LYNKTMKPIPPVRPSPIAGSWYSDKPAQLSAEIDAYLDDAALPALDGEVVALIAPHAGFMYSGAVAGHAFATVRERDFDLVAVLSPFHALHANAFLTSAHTAYRTPLGTIDIDRDAVAAIDAALRAELGIGITPVARDREHSLEIELPFLQRALTSDFALLPIMIRSVGARELEVLGKAIANLLRGRNALLVASTDLSHFHTQDVANMLDGEMLRQIEAFSPEGVLEAEELHKGFACGRGAVAATLYAARELGADSVKVLNYATSGDVTGDFSSVVGYGAAVVCKYN
jgi:AmmeMemoRadiSam system protein B